MEERSDNTIKGDRAFWRNTWIQYWFKSWLQPGKEKKEKTHVQPDEKDLAAAPHMNNNKLSMEKKKKKTRTKKRIVM